MTNSEAARLIALAALVQYETARMVAENQWRDRRGEAPAYCGEDWYCHEAEILRALFHEAGA